VAWEEYEVGSRTNSDNGLESEGGANDVTRSGRIDGSCSCSFEGDY